MLATVEVFGLLLLTGVLPKPLSNARAAGMARKSADFEIIIKTLACLPIEVL